SPSWAGTASDCGSRSPRMYASTVRSGTRDPTEGGISRRYARRTLSSSACRTVSRHARGRRNSGDCPLTCIVQKKGQTPHSHRAKKGTGPSFAGEVPAQERDRPGHRAGRVLLAVAGAGEDHGAAVDAGGAQRAGHARGLRRRRRVASRGEEQHRRVAVVDVVDGGGQGPRVRTAGEVAAEIGLDGRRVLAPQGFEVALSRRA